MIIAITGTPGVGKSSIASVLRENGYEVVDLFKIAVDNGFVDGNDEERHSWIVNVDKLNDYVKKNYARDGIVFIDSHLSHCLKCADRVIILRCHPTELRKRLSFKGWSDEKVKENLEAEILDVILVEAVDIHPAGNIFEIDTTGKSSEEVMSSFNEIINNTFKHMKKYNIGNIDWSEEIFKDFWNISKG
jgi:adenylate kinase